MLYLSEKDVCGLLHQGDELLYKDGLDRFAMDQVIGLLEQGFRDWADGSAANEPRQRVRAPKLADRGGTLLHLMGAADSRSGYIGCKAYTTSRSGGNFFFVLLFAADSGKPLATIEADYLGQVRTGAASAVATKYMARKDAYSLAIIGAGGQAWTQALALDRVCQLADVRVYSRDLQRRQDFGNRLSVALHTSVTICSDARQAVAGADIVVTATTSSDPVFFGEWIEPGMHINAIGGNAASRRELDQAAMRRVDRIVADSVEQSRIESGELLSVDRWAEVIELSQVVAGKAPGRATPEEVTLFKSNGIALEDIAIGGWLYEQARKVSQD